MKKRKFDYKWVILAAGFLMVFVCLGFCSANKGLYLGAITEALGIKRSLFSINDSCRFIATAVINLFFGTLVGRFGVRKMTAFGFAALIASTLLYAFAENIFVFYIGGVLLGVGLAFTTTSMASSVIRRFFKSNIGKYTGIVFAANGIGGAIAAQIVSPLINKEGDPFGYRTSYLLVTAILVVTGIIVVSLLREGPKGENISSVPIKEKKKARGAVWDGISYDIVKKRSYFYFVAAGVFLTGFILHGISGVFAAHMEDVGFSSEYVATVVSVYSLALTATKILVGVIYDHLGLRSVLLICQGATVAAFLLMVFVTPVGIGPVLAMLFGILYAIALPLETLVIPLIVNDLFGSASYDKILGIFLAMNYAGYALGSPATNLCYDTFGTYNPIFVVFAVLMLLFCGAFQRVITVSYKEKKKIISTK